MGPPNSSQTVSVSSPQSRSSSSAFSSSLAVSAYLSVYLARLLFLSLPSGSGLRFWCLLFLLSCVSDSLAVALIREPTPPRSVSSQVPGHLIPPSPLFPEPGFGEKQARRTRRYPFLEALYSCHLDTFCTKPHVPKQHRPSRGKKGIAKNKNSQHRTLFACLDTFSRSAIDLLPTTLSCLQLPKKYSRSHATQPTQHDTRNDDSIGNLLFPVCETNKVPWTPTKESRLFMWHSRD